MTLGHALEVIFAVFRHIGGDRDIVPVEPDPLLEFRQSHEFRGVIRVRAGHFVLEGPDIVETARYLDLDFGFGEGLI